MQIALDAAAKLAEDGIAVRVVSMPSWELFRAQDEGYRNEVLPPDVKARVAVEAGSPQGWCEWLGDDGDMVGITTFGASAPYKEIYKQYGLTPENVAARAKALL